jgi:hypothetical protein
MRAPVHLLYEPCQQSHLYSSTYGSSSDGTDSHLWRVDARDGDERAKERGRTSARGFGGGGGGGGGGRPKSLGDLRVAAEWGRDDGI